MSLRAIAALLVGVFSTLAVAASVSFVAATSALHETSVQLLETTASIQATQALEASLLTHSQESILLAVTGEDSHLSRRSQASEDLAKWLAESHLHVSSPEEAAIVRQAEQAVARYFADHDALEKSKVGAAEMAREVAVASETAIGQLQRLTALNVAQGKDAYAKSVDYERFADWLGIGFIVLVVGTSAAILLLFRRLVFRPVLAIHHAIRSFRVGESATVNASGATELKEVSAAFGGMADEIRQQKESHFRYLAAVAHDLRNPVGALKMSADLAMAEYGHALPSDVVQMLGIMQRQSSHLDRMVADLLDTARSEGGQLELKRSRHDLRRVVEDARDLFKTYSPGHRLAATVPSEAVLAEVDPVRLGQVVNNLISNAIKYSPHGGRVQVTLEREDSEAVIKVTDPGMGIAPADRETIFEPFRRASATKDAIPGVGLGLFTSRRIIVAHGGRIEVASTVGKGSTFSVRLPLVDAQGETEPTAAASLSSGKVFAPSRASATAKEVSFS
jgi:signal transduction histidine kinase